ncbi:MAG TPA: hypothetical protein VEA59_02290 [Patescibacteria group bacterium]|nr:hypothetical protein [Patescibacteria group bacterium]
MNRNKRAMTYIAGLVVITIVLLIAVVGGLLGWEVTEPIVRNTFTLVYHTEEEMELRRYAYAWWVRWQTAATVFCVLAVAFPVIALFQLPKVEDAAKRNAYWCIVIFLLSAVQYFAVSYFTTLHYFARHFHLNLSAMICVMAVVYAFTGGLMHGESIIASFRGRTADYDSET